MSARSSAMATVSHSIWMYIPSSSILVYRKIASIIAILFTVSVVLRCFFRKNLTDKEGHPIPPGPLLRYAFLRKYPERPVHVWAKRFGPLYSVWMGNKLFVVINDPVSARDLLVVHGANFSSRWRYFMKNEAILRGGSITAAPYDDTWRKHRRIAMGFLTAKAIQGYADVLDDEARILISSLYRETQQGKLPVNAAPFASHFALNNMLAITIGTRTNSASDPLVQQILLVATEFMQLTGPWSNMIDFIKPLQWIPTTMRSRGRNLHQDFKEVYGAMIMRVRDQMDSGESVPDCLVKTLLECQEAENLDWTDMCFISNVFMTGGVHSTSGVIQWFLALIPSHLDIQAKAHEELDRIIGRDHWPTAEDEMQLPYIRAIIKEVLRIHSPFWTATPHYSENDFVYKGMYIPKNTVMVLNCYSLHHNEERYPDPWKFNPERYLGDNLTSAESSRLADATERDHWAFGAGRRICPGMIVAERELWLAISRLLWAFVIQPVPGEPISLEEYEGKSGRTPIPFRVKLSPRHENVHSVLVSKVEEELII